jgi:hypothetical protein
MFGRTIVLASMMLVIAGCALGLPPGDGVPVTIDGLPIITVSQALAAREAGDSGELAVGGWFSEAPVHPCPAPLAEDGKLAQPHPFEFYCRVNEWALAERRESVADVVVENQAISAALRQIAGPWFQPVLEGNAREEIFGGDRDTWVPVLVVLIGHFGDPDALTCPPDVVQTCLERFVATRAVRVD